MKQHFSILVVGALVWAAACGGSAVDDRSGGGSSGRGGASGSSGSAGSSGRGGSSGAGAVAGVGGIAGAAGAGAVAGVAGTGAVAGTGGTGGSPAACESARRDYQRAVEANTSCNLTLNRETCAIAAPAECCSLTVDSSSQAEAIALRVAALLAACGPPACPEIVCPRTPSRICEPDSSGAALGHCR